MTPLLAWARRLAARRRSDLLAVLWTARALAATRAQLREQGVHTVVPRSPIGLRARSIRAVTLSLWLRRATCLERSLVVQRWLADHHVLRTVAIGVGTHGGSGSFQAHAWVQGFDPTSNEKGFEVIRRLEPVLD